MNKIKESSSLRKSKRADFNFVLLFAILAGIAILILAIYGAIKAGDSLRGQSEAELAKTIEIITDPLQAGFASTTTSRIEFRQETLINNDCNYFSGSGFGRNEISVTTESTIGDKFSENPLAVSVYNKYIFSESQSGKTFYVFSKPFDLSYKVADLLFISAQNYCLVSPPEKIAEEFLALNTKNIGIETSTNNTCSDDSIRVCFGYGRCNITVTGKCTGSSCDTPFDYGFVSKDGDKLAYSGNLLYGAIFSEKDLYECNVNRLLFRASKIADTLSQKADLMNARGCNTLLKPDVDYLATATQNATSEDLESLFIFSQNLDKEIKKERCNLW